MAGELHQIRILLKDFALDAELYDTPTTTMFMSLLPVEGAANRFFDGSTGVENLGFVDTLALHWNVNHSSIQSFYNPYAAMPSLHQGWTLMIGIGIIWMTKSWVGRAIGALLPALMFVGIIATGNHFFLDAVGGALVIAIAIIITVIILKYVPISRYRERSYI